MQKIHFIAIGGSAMHNLAIALKSQGHLITGSDDEIVDPSYSRLYAHGLLPDQMGWFPEQNIHSQLDAVILGMHARADNPELLAAQKLGLKIYSYPEFIFSRSQHKQRVVVAGSHGKTTITSMIMHVLKHAGKKFDYLVGAKLEGFDTMIQLSDAPILVIEGDEYLASPIDRVPKFMHYHHHMVVLSGVAWDHINVFPTKESYFKVFKDLLTSTTKSGVIIYNEDDDFLHKTVKEIKREDLHIHPYGPHKNKLKDDQLMLSHDEGLSPIHFFGEHNMYNVQAAKEACMKLGVEPSVFYTAISSFRGASNRLELLGENQKTKIYKDFAHAPSKLKATTRAIAERFPKQKKIACIELHTFSSLTKDFLSQYENCFDKTDINIVYFNPKNVSHKNLPDISKADIEKGFGKSKVQVYDNSEALKKYFDSLNLDNTILLWMSSGNFDGWNLKEFATHLLNK